MISLQIRIISLAGSQTKRFRNRRDGPMAVANLNHLIVSNHGTLLLTLVQRGGGERHRLLSHLYIHMFAHNLFGSDKLFNSCRYSVYTYKGNSKVKGTKITKVKSKTISIRCVEHFSCLYRRYPVHFHMYSDESGSSCQRMMTHQFVITSTQ